jgi:hypothetical protein
MNAHREWLIAWFGLAWKHAPAHTSIRSILQALDPQELEQAFRVHSQQLLDSRADADAPPAVAVDGKVLRRSFDRFQDQKAAQLLSAFCQSEHLIPGHLPVSTKTNEIPLAQQLIEELGLEGCPYTFDALHCQKKSSMSPLNKEVR